MPPADTFSTHIGAAAAKQVRSLHDLADKTEDAGGRPDATIGIP
jgi:hypothetical protein